LDWLPGTINPNLRAARWARQHGKPMVASSDAHELGTIGRNPSTVEADELTPGAIFRAIRAGRVTFQRRGLRLVPMIYHTSGAVFSQTRHVRRWVHGRFLARPESN
jgi:predicted metal-dependent phosphoesterase TrpH